MTADSQGNDLDAALVPISGLAAFAPILEANVIDAEDLGASPLTLPTAYKRLGLFKQGGGFSPTRNTGDPIEFFQIGYKKAGDGTRGVTVGLAEQNATVLALTEGVTPDENGVYKVSSSLPDNQFILLLVTRYRGGFEKRQIGVASITEIEFDQSERGALEGLNVTFTWQEHDLFDGSPFWQFGPAAPVAGEVEDDTPPA